MTFVHPTGAARPARIRILGTTAPPPPPRRGPRWGLLAACVVVAAFGVGTTLLVRPQIADDPSPAVFTGETIDVMGGLNLGARMPDARTLRVLSISAPDYDSAARIAAARQRVTVVNSPTTGVVPAVSSPVAAGTTPTPAQQSPSTAPATVTGPDQPPNPASPNTLLDQS